MENNINITCLKVGPYRANCYIVTDKSGETFIIDPGAGAKLILTELFKIKNLKLKTILLTHAHFDHVGAVDELHRAFPNVPIYLHENDFRLISELPEQGLFVGEIIKHIKSFPEAISDGMFIPFSDTEIKVIHTPGHTPGGVCFLLIQNTKEKIQKILFTGDTLFYHTIGRTDLPYSNNKQMRISLESLLNLNKDTTVLPGHGRETTIEEERKQDVLSSLPI